MRKKWLIAALPILLLALPGWTQIYKVTDDEEGVVFTDRPETISNTGHQNVEEVEIQEINTAAPVDVPPPPPPTATATEEPEVVAPTVSITSPTNESTIAMGPGNFAVSASVAPPLNRGELLVLMIDGQAYGAPQTSSSWFVEAAIRGPHDLVVQRTNSRGKTIALSEPVRVYVLRPSVIGR